MARPHAAIRFSTASNQAISSELKYRISINPATRPPPDDPTASHRYTEPVASPADAPAAACVNLAACREQGSGKNAERPKRGKRSEQHGARPQHLARHRLEQAFGGAHGQDGARAAMAAISTWMAAIRRRGWRARAAKRPARLLPAAVQKSQLASISPMELSLP